VFNLPFNTNHINISAHGGATAATPLNTDGIGRSLLIELSYFQQAKEKDLTENLP